MMITSGNQISHGQGTMASFKLYTCIALVGRKTTDNYQLLFFAVKRAQSIPCCHVQCSPVFGILKEL